MFYLAYFVMSVGQGQAGWLTVMTLLNHWFVRHRGLAMGLAMVGMGIGTLVLVPVIAWLIDPDADRLAIVQGVLRRAGAGGQRRRCG